MFVSVKNDPMGSDLIELCVDFFNHATIYDSPCIIRTTNQEEWGEEEADIE